MPWIRLAHPPLIIDLLLSLSLSPISGASDSPYSIYDQLAFDDCFFKHLPSIPDTRTKLNMMGEVRTHCGRISRGCRLHTR